MRKEEYTSTRVLTKEFLRNQGAYLTRLEDEVESIILEKLLENPKADSVAITIRKDFVNAAVNMLQLIYRYELTPVDSVDKPNVDHEYVEFKLSW